MRDQQTNTTESKTTCSSELHNSMDEIQDIQFKDRLLYAATKREASYDLPI